MLIFEAQSKFQPVAYKGVSAKTAQFYNEKLMLEIRVFSPQNTAQALTTERERYYFRARLKSFVMLTVLLGISLTLRRIFHSALAGCVGEQTDACICTK